MALTTAQKTDLYRFFALAFDAAPGVTFMNQLDEAINSPMTLKQVVNEFIKKPEFTSIYFNFLTNQEFARKFVDRNVASTATTAAKDEAVTQITALLNAGHSRGDVIVDVFGALAATPFTDTKWGDTAKLLSNQVAYARYYTETLGLGGEASPNIAALRNVIKNVTATSPTDAGSIAAALNSFAGQTFNLTTGIDNLQPGPGNDTYTGTAGTWNTGDVVNGGNGTDTLNVTVSGAGPTLTAASLVSVEVLNVTASPNPVTLSLTGVTGLQQVNNLSSANGASLLVSGLGNAVNTTITGGNTSTTINYGTAVTASTATTDAATVTLAGVGVGSSFTTGGIETLTVNSTTAANNATLTASGVTKLVITGDQALTIANAATAGVGGTTIASVDASAATGAITLITGAGAGGTAATGVTVTAPTAATAGTFTITTGGNKDTVVLGAGVSVVNTGAGDDIITGGAGANTITPGTGNDTLNLGAGVDTVRLADVGATNADTINNFGTTDVIALNIGAAAVTGTNATAASANAAFGVVPTSATSPVLQNVAGTATANAVTFQAVTPNATATVGTVSGTSNVIALNGAFSDGTAAGVITALGTTATTGITTTSAGRFVLVTYSVGNIAQVWSYGGDANSDSDIQSTELSLVATLNGVSLGGLTAANFATYLTPAASATTVSNSGQTINLSLPLNTVTTAANTAGQFFSAAADTVNVGVGALPTGAASTTMGLTLVDATAGDADVFNATVLNAAWDTGTLLTQIETVNLAMLVADANGFAMTTVMPGTTALNVTGTQNLQNVSGIVSGTAFGLGADYTGTLGITPGATIAAVTLNLNGTPGTSAATSPTFTSDQTITALTVNANASTTLNLGGANGPFERATGATLQGAGNVTLFGAAADFGTAKLNASGVGYTGALTVRPSSNAAMNFADATSVTGIRTIDLRDIAAFNSQITLAAANNSAAYGSGAINVAFAPTSSSSLAALPISILGTGTSDALAVSLGANATGVTGAITAAGFETVTISSAATSGTIAIANVVMDDAAGSQTVTVTGAGNFTLGEVTADTVNTTGVTGTVTAKLVQSTAGTVFVGGNGNTTITGGTGGADQITTGTGNDNVKGGDGADQINTGAGNDTIDGEAGADVITAGDGADSILGDAGADVISGGDGADTITGGTAIDSLTGGAGADTFVLNGIVAAANRDVIIDFVSGTDKLSIQIGETTVSTAAGATAITGTSTTAAGTGGGNYTLAGNNTAATPATITTANTDLIRLTVTAAGTNSGDLSAATDGTELLKALTDATAADTYNGIVAANNDKGYIQATQGGKTYLYYYKNDADTLLAAAEIILVGVFDNGVVLTAGDITLAP